MNSLQSGLRTSRLIIRDPVMEDLESWHRLLSDKINMYYLYDIVTNSLDETRERLAEAVLEAASPRRAMYFLSVELAESKTFIGNVGYTVEAFTSGGKIVHIGYFYMPEYHRMGYASEALRELLRFAFQEDSVYRAKTGLFAENCASEQVMKKCGMIKEGTHKEAEWLDGRFRDRLSYRLLKHEWLAQTNNPQGAKHV